MTGVIDACDGCRSLQLATTNDNLLAIRFYERRGFGSRQCDRAP
jgi:ribosomal protein S18 acetylase RimI-like enzyme